MARLDPHSHTDIAQPHQRHLSWKAEVDFAGRTVQATATLLFDRGGATVDLDSRGLEVQAVTSPEGRPLQFDLGAPEPIVGQRFRVALPAGVDSCVIRYRTGPEASALQWLEPEQTAGGKAPFLYSQCQAIHARSVVPLQDSPRLRITYDAELTVPAALRGLMAAGAVDQEVRGDRAVERYRMDEPIPVPLRLRGGRPGLGSWGPEPGVGRAVGGRPRGPRIRSRGRMLTSAEALFGPYS
jgi:aminopeptidase N